MDASKSLRKPFAILFIIVATELIGFGLIIPILPQLSLQFNVSNLAIGILMGSYSFAQFIAAPILGSLSDRYGRKPILFLSKVGTVLSYIILAFSNSFYLFLISRLIDGFTGGNIAVARAYIADITTKENRAKGMAIIGISFGVGFLLGPIIGGFIYSDSMSFHSAAWVAAGLSFFAAILTLILLKEPERNSVTESTVLKIKNGLVYLKHPIIMIIFSTYFFYMILFSFFETSFSVFTHYLFEFSPQQNSWLFVFSGVLALLIQGSIMRSKFKKLHWVCIFGILLMGISFICFSLINSILGILLCVGLLTLGIAITNTFLPAFLTLFTPDNQHGQVMGFYESIGSISRIIGPLIGYQWIMIKPRLGYFYAGIILLCILFAVIAFGFISNSARNKLNVVNSN